MTHLKRIFVGAVLAIGCAGKAETGADGTPGKQPNSPLGAPSAAQAVPKRHLMLVVELEPGGQRATTVDFQIVDLPLPKRRVPVKGPWQVEVLASDGTTLYTAQLPDSSLVRGEFKGNAGQIESVTARKTTTALTLRLPVLAGATTVRLVDLGEASANRATSELGRVPYPKVTP